MTIITRRSFVHKLFALTALSYLSISSKKLRATPLLDISVIVVGAGLAGLAAAKRLIDLGAEVQVGFQPQFSWRDVEGERGRLQLSLELKEL